MISVIAFCKPSLHSRRRTDPIIHFGPVRFGPLRSIIQLIASVASSRELSRRWDITGTLRDGGVFGSSESRGCARLPLYHRPYLGATQSSSSSPALELSQYVLSVRGPAHHQRYTMSNDESFNSLFTATDSIDGIWPFLQSVSVVNRESRLTVFSLFLFYFLLFVFLSVLPSVLPSPFLPSLYCGSAVFVISRSTDR